MRPIVPVAAVLAVACVLLQAALADAAGSQVAGPLDTHASQIVSALASGDFASVMAQADSSMSSQADQSSLENVWTSNSQIMGDYQSIGQPTSVTCGDLTVEQVPVQFSNGSENVQIAFHQDGTIAGLYILLAATPVMC